MGSLCVFLNRVPSFLSANVCLQGPVWIDSVLLSANILLMGLNDVCLNWFSPFLFCQCLFGETYWYLSELNLIFLVHQCLLDKFFFSLFVWSVSQRCSVYVWTNPTSSCQYLSSEFNRCLPEVFPNVFCQICLKGSLDVFPDQPNIFLACVCLMGLISVCPSWFSPVSFCQCLLWGTCWCLSGLNSRVFLPVSF